MGADKVSGTDFGYIDAGKSFFPTRFSRRFPTPFSHSPAEDASLWREHWEDALRMARSWAAAKLRCFLQRLEPREIRTPGSSLTKKSSAQST